MSEHELKKIEPIKVVTAPVVLQSNFGIACLLGWYNETGTELVKKATLSKDGNPHIVMDFIPDGHREFVFSGKNISHVDEFNKDGKRISQTCLDDNYLYHQSRFLYEEDGETVKSSQLWIHGYPQITF
mgnify:FL=1